MTQEYLKPKEASAYTKISSSTLAKLRCYGGGPRYCKVGRAVLYRKDDLDVFMASAVIASTFEKSMW